MTILLWIAALWAVFVPLADYLPENGGGNWQGYDDDMRAAMMAQAMTLPKPHDVADDEPHPATHGLEESNNE